MMRKLVVLCTRAVVVTHGLVVPVQAKPKVPVVREGEVEEISPDPFPWGYQENFEGKTLFQCGLITVSKAANGASESIITIAALQKGTIVITLDDDELEKMIAMT
jgi:hypothetical protein